MKQDAIVEIRVNADGRLCVVPFSESFPYIYRTGMEVHWDEAGKYLYSPQPKEWTYSRWFQQILAAVKSEYHCVLVITPETHWRNVEVTLKKALISSSGDASA